MHKLPHHGSLVVLSSASPLEIQGVAFCSSARGSTGFSLFEFSDLQCNPSYSLFCKINDSAWAAIVEKQKYVDEVHCVFSLKRNRVKDAVCYSFALGVHFNFLFAGKMK